MRLKKLIVQGFKSFADRTEFVFDAPITGIVGPNGCGQIQRGRFLQMGIGRAVGQEPPRRRD